MSFSSLLEDGARRDLRLHRELHLDPLRVRLRPEELGVHQSHLFHEYNEVSASRGLYQHCRKWSFLGEGCEPGTSIYGNVDITL